MDDLKRAELKNRACDSMAAGMERAMYEALKQAYAPARQKGECDGCDKSACAHSFDNPLGQCRRHNAALESAKETQKFAGMRHLAQNKATANLGIYDVRGGLAKEVDPATDGAWLTTVGKRHFTCVQSCMWPSVVWSIEEASSSIGIALLRRDGLVVYEPVMGDPSERENWLAIFTNYAFNHTGRDHEIMAFYLVRNASEVPSEWLPGRPRSQSQGLAIKVKGPLPLVHAGEEVAQLPLGRNEKVVIAESYPERTLRGARFLLRAIDTDGNAHLSPRDSEEVVLVVAGQWIEHELDVEPVDPNAGMLQRDKEGAVKPERLDWAFGLSGAQLREVLRSQGRPPSLERELWLMDADESVVAVHSLDQYDPARLVRYIAGG
jgi:hypothetical protein